MSEKIAVIIPEIFSALDYELLDGIYSQAKLSGTDVLVFTGVKNSSGEFYDDAYIHGLRNIYELLKTDSIDGIIFIPGRFHDRRIAADINRMIISSGTPCIVIGAESEYFPYMFADQSEYIRQITRHLTDCHGCRKLYFLSGMKGEYNSEERRKGFEKALSEAGIPFDESDILYGYFWKLEPIRIAKDIAEGRIKKPDAVVCANDTMAVALCAALAENGIKVPDDIKITGYDGEYSIISHMPSLTTVVGNEERLGRDAFQKLWHMITGKNTEMSPDTVKIRFGTSCGCSARAIESGDRLVNYIGTVIDHFVEQGLYLGTDIVERMSNVNSVEELVERIHSFSYLIGGWKNLDVCLCEDWKFSMKDPSIYREKGYSERMINIVSDIYGGESNSESVVFPLEELSVSLERPHDALIYVFTSLHSKQQIFGYMVTTYSSVYDIYMTEHYMNWCDALSNGLRVLQEKMHFEYVRQQIEILSVNDPSTGFFNKRGLLENLPNFITECHRAEAVCIMIMLNISGYSTHMPSEFPVTLANAIKNSASENEYHARPDDNTFCIIIKGSSKQNAEKSYNARLMSVQQKLQEIQAGSSELIRIRYIHDFMIIDEQDISETSRCVEQMLSGIKQRAEEDGNFNYSEHLNQLRRHIYTEPQHDWNIDEMQKQIGISRSHLQRLYKSMFSVSCTDDVINARISKACQLLKNTDLSVREIAVKCGYNDESHFMRQFKKRTGITALQFRKNKTDII